MPDRRDPPPTDEGWYALHDFRRIDWNAWNDASPRTRERALSEAVSHLESALAVDDAEEGVSAVYTVLGDKADILILHLRPTTAHIGALERQFELTEFGSFTERTTSFVSITEASGYSERARDYFEGELDENSGLANYIKTRLKPSIPDATHVCFYPMSKRRDPGQNWYDLSFDERAEHMEAHGDIGRDYGGKVVQMITGAIAIDDWEWGVTLWGDDLVDMKDLLYEMRFDPSTSQFAEFGPFYVGRRFPPSDLHALLAGQAVPTDGEATPDSLAAAGPIHPADAETAPGHATGADGEGSHGTTPHAGEDHGETAQAEHGHDEEDADDDSDAAESASGPPMGGGESDVASKTVADIETRLGRFGLHESEDFTEGDYAVLLYSDADATDVADELDDLRANFDHYDTHVGSTVRAADGRSAIVSIWENERAADIAEGFLTDMTGVTESIRGPIDGDVDESETGGEETTGESHAAQESGEIRKELQDLNIYSGQPHGEDIYALVLYSDAPLEDLTEEVEGLSDGFDRYDTHDGTAVYDAQHGERTAVVSLWATADAANTASEYLSDLPGIVGWADEGDGFSTMGMFYRVKPEHREDFVETFADVGELLAEMDGHRETALLVNTDDKNDMFIASQWDSKGDAMEFFGSDAFSDTVKWGRDVLADKPRHVFLA